MRLPIFLSLFCMLLAPAYGQQRSLVVAAYNVENLFDTVNDPGIHDAVLSPIEYERKLLNLASVIGELSPDVLVMCVVDKSDFLSDLHKTSPLDGVPYRYVHYDSPDMRGIDVALIYLSDRVKMLSSEPIAAPDRYLTRDILRVELLADTTRLVIYGVHLPSRRGGRNSATRMRGRLADSLNVMAAREDCGVIVLGDFNDNPNSKLIVNRLSNLTCLTAEPFRRGQGSYAWRDSWLMYDNILVTSRIKTNGPANVWIRPRLLTPTGRFRGYPYRGEYSDHLPVYINLLF